MQHLARGGIQESGDGGVLAAIAKPEWRTWRLGRLAAVAVLACLAGCGSGGSTPPQNAGGAVYVMTNDPSTNSVLQYTRSADGALVFSGSFPTGGSGAGTGPDPLASQDALVLDPENHFLFAVNAGSNEISMFEVKPTRLVLLDKESSGGTMPISVAAGRSLVYVLNAGGTPNISGFSIDRNGKRLVPLSGSEQPLAGGSSADPADIRFNANATVLLVTEKGTQTIDSYTVNSRGLASPPISNSSNGMRPFGLSVTKQGIAIVAEAGSDAASSYELTASAELGLITGSVALGQKAPWWLATTPDGRFAYTANAGSGTISSLSIAPDGALTLIDATAADLAGAPIDLTISSNGEFLYVREGPGAVNGFRVERDGSLTPVASVAGLPTGAQGIAAR